MNTSTSYSKTNQTVIAYTVCTSVDSCFYDPKLSQFLSPDNFVADATSTQAYNRYAYCWNLPLIYTDPNGEFVQFIIGGIIGGFSGWGVYHASLAYSYHASGIKGTGLKYNQ